MKTPALVIFPYANMGPKRLLGPPADCEFLCLVPSQAKIALRREQAIAAPLPIADWPGMQELIKPLGSCGIAAAGPVDSVLCFSRKPLGELTPADTIWLTEQSSSSVRLLFLLLGWKLGFENLPQATTDPSSATAKLVIGDNALMHASEPAFPVATDLAREWHDLTGLPFVFARWAVLRNISPRMVQHLEAWLQEFATREEQLLDQAARIEGERLGIEPARMLRYLRGMKRMLDDAELEGQAKFLAALKRHGRKPLFRPAQNSKTAKQQNSKG